MDTNFPSDLLEQIKKFIRTKGSQYDEKKVFFYIDCTASPPKLVFEKWTYDFPPPGENFPSKKKEEK